MKKILKLLVLIFILILIICIILFIIKFNKVNRIIELMAKNSEIDNYYFEDEEMVKERYKNIVKISFGNYENSYYYYDFNNMKCYIVDENNNYYFETDISEIDKEILDFPLYSSFTRDYSLKNKLKLVFDLKIKNYDENCYEIITKENRKIIFDKNSGYILKSEKINSEDSDNKNFVNISVNTVSIDDVKIPNLEIYSENR